VEFLSRGPKCIMQQNRNSFAELRLISPQLHAHSLLGDERLRDDILLRRYAGQGGSPVIRARNKFVRE